MQKATWLTSCIVKLFIIMDDYNTQPSYLKEGCGTKTPNFLVQHVPYVCFPAVNFYQVCLFEFASTNSILAKFA